MNACLASTIHLFISLVHLPLLEISEPGYRKCSVCLIEFPFKESGSLGTVSSLVTTRYSVFLTLIDIPYRSRIFPSSFSIFSSCLCDVEIRTVSSAQRILFILTPFTFIPSNSVIYIV